MSLPSKRMTTQHARDDFDGLLETVHHTKVPVVVERDGIPAAVLMSVEEYERIKARRERGWAAVRRVWAYNKDADPVEIERDIEAAIEEVRRARG